MPQPPKRLGVEGPHGPASRTPGGILTIVVIAVLAGGAGVCGGWFAGVAKSGSREREAAEARLKQQQAEWSGQVNELERQRQEAVNRVGLLDRAGAELLGRLQAQEKTLAEGRAAFESLAKQAQEVAARGGEAMKKLEAVGDLPVLVSEQERLIRLLRGAGEEFEGYRQGVYVVLRAKAGLFDEGSMKPNTAAVGLLQKLAALVKGYEGPYRMCIEGHTDSSPGISVAGEGSNMHAGALRALGVMAVLADAGVPLTKMCLVSQGEVLPRELEIDGEKAKKNRRVEFVFAPMREALAAATAEMMPLPGEAPRAPAVVPAAAAPTNQAPAAPAVPVAAPAVAAPVAAPPVATPVAPPEPVPAAPAVIETGTVPEAQKKQP